MAQLIARERDLTVGPGTRVTLHFSILLASGEEIDTTRNGKAVSFDVGDGRLLPGFEQALFGLSAGAAEQLALAPEVAFGQPLKGNIQTFPRSQFSVDIDCEPGLVISFASPNGEISGVVQKVLESSVIVDFNHPLAGKSVVFDVAILSVVPSSAT